MHLGVLVDIRWCVQRAHARADGRAGSDQHSSNSHLYTVRRPVGGHLHAEPCASHWH
jgi:hypothetical protein